MMLKDMYYETAQNTAFRRSLDAANHAAVRAVESDVARTVRRPNYAASATTRAGENDESRAVRRTATRRAGKACCYSSFP